LPIVCILPKNSPYLKQGDFKRMQNLYYLPKNISLEQAKELYKEQEKIKFPNQNLSYLDDRITPSLVVYQNHVSLKVFLKKIERFSTVIFWQIKQINMPFEEFEKIVKGLSFKSITIRFLDPEILIDPETKEGLQMLDILSKTAKVNQPNKQPGSKPSNTLPGAPIPKLDEKIIQLLRQDRKALLTVDEIVAKRKISMATVCKYTKDLTGYVFKKRAKEKEKLKKIAMRKSVAIPDLKEDSNLALYSAAFLNNQRSEGTKKIYHSRLKQFFAYVRNELDMSVSDPTQINEDIGQKYLTHLKDAKKGNSSIHLDFAPLKSFFSYLKEKGIIARNPFKLIKTPIVSNHVVKADSLEASEVDRILKRAVFEMEQSKETDDDYKQKLANRNFLMIYLLSSVGMRLGALLSIRLKDVKTRNGVTTLTMAAKNSDTYTVLITKENANEVQRYINTYLSDADPDYHIFHGVNRGTHLSYQKSRMIIKDITKRAGIDRHVNAKMFRVTWATLAHQEGMEIRKIMHQLNHKNINQTMAYIRLAHVTIEPSWVPSVTKLSNLGLENRVF